MATPIENNTAELQSILDAVNSLPNASSAKLQTKSVTPSASSQEVKPDSGYDGLSRVTVAGDSDLVAGNIKQGVNLFGVTGNLQTGVNVQTKSGSFTTDSNGAASVSLGFKPDVVFITQNQSEDGYRYDAAVDFAAMNADFTSLALWTTDTPYYVWSVNVSRSTNGFSILGIYGFQADWGGAYANKKTFQYTAVKYTA